MFSFQSVLTISLGVVETMGQCVQLGQCYLQLQSIMMVLRRQLQQILVTAVDRKSSTKKQHRVVKLLLYVTAFTQWITYVIQTLFSLLLTEL